jgi:hypothetical protein
MLYTKEDKGFLLNEVQILGPDYINELVDDFTVQEVNKFILIMRSNEATACDGIPAEAWKTLVANAEGTEILMKLFPMIRSKRECPKEWKTASIQPFYKGKGSQRELGSYRGISLFPVMGKYIQEL